MQTVYWRLHPYRSMDHPNRGAAVPPPMLPDPMAPLARAGSNDQARLALHLVAPTAMPSTSSLSGTVRTPGLSPTT